MIMTKTVDKEQVATLIRNFFETFEKSCNSKREVTVSDFEDILAPDFRITSNGRNLANNLGQYIKRVTDFQKRYKRFKIHQKTDNFIVAESHFAVFYEIEASTQDGTPCEVFVMAMGKHEGRKITEWIQVAHERGTGKHWE